MLVPFRGNVTEKMVSCIKSLISVVDRMRTSWTVGKVSPPDDVWRCLQAELALEKFFWGRIDWGRLDNRGYTHLKKQSVMLGPGHEDPEDTCLTDSLGFLALSGECLPTTGQAAPIPPPQLWTAHWLQQRMLTRIWEVRACSHFESHSFGEMAIKALVEELACYSWPDEKKCKRLYQEGETQSVLRKLKFKGLVQVDHIVPGTNWKVVGQINLARLAQKALDGHYVTPMVFAKMVQACARPHPVVDLENGIRVLGLKFFPKFETTQVGHHKVYWKGKEVYKIQYPELQASDATEWRRLSVQTEYIKNRLVNNDIVDRCELIRSLDHVQIFPWLKTVMSRLGKMTGKVVAITLTFLSGIGLMQNGIHVDQQALIELLNSMPFHQPQLQALKVLGEYSASSERQIFGLHREVPWKIQSRPQETRTRTGTTVVPPPDLELQLEPEQPQPRAPKRATEDSDDVPEPQRKTARNIDKRNWTRQELRLLMAAVRECKAEGIASRQKMYELYVTMCVSAGTEPRTWRSFDKKSIELEKPQKDLELTMLKTHHLYCQQHFPSMKMDEEYKRYVEKCQENRVEPRTLRGYRQKCLTL